MIKSPTYFVRWKGQQFGPFTKDQINQKVRDQELSLAHEIQADGKWRPLRSFLNLGEQAQEQERQKLRFKQMQDELDNRSVALEETKIQLKKTRTELTDTQRPVIRTEVLQSRAEVPQIQPSANSASNSSNPIDQLIRRVKSKPR